MSDPIKILLTGKNGQVGHELLEGLRQHPGLTAVDVEDFDLSDEEHIRTLVRDVRPNLILNAAAYTAVDAAEKELDLAYSINAHAVDILAREAKALGSAMVHFSTDYVYDGCKQGPYVETDPVNPLSVYGKSKLAGDDALASSGIPYLIFRTSWVYGSRGKNFFLTMNQLTREREELKIVDDQHGAPTWCRSIAKGTLKVLKNCLGDDLMKDPSCLREVSGVYHLSARGATTWFGFTRAIVAALSLENPPHLIPIPTSEYPLPAPRPSNSILDNKRLETTFGVKLPEWNSALRECALEMNPPSS